MTWQGSRSAKSPSSDNGDDACPPVAVACRLASRASSSAADRVPRALSFCPERRREHALVGWAAGRRKKSAPILATDFRPDDFAYKRLGMNQHDCFGRQFLRGVSARRGQVAADCSRWVSVKRDTE